MAKSASSPVAAPTEIRVSKVEGLKERSDFLREPVASELLLDTNYFSNDAVQILKFHGSYQQVDRDLQKPGQEKPYQMMLRTRSPGGFIPPQLYLTLDRLASDYGNETLRATTRQGFQLHGILKKNLKPTIAAIVKAMGSTLGACGDLNRNVMAPPAPYKNRPDYQLALTYANNIADLLTPQTGAYYEIWLDGEKVISAEEDPAVKAARSSNGSTPMRLDTEEPIYGAHYMPRKFKCAVTVPGDNSVDLFSQDLSLVVITDAKGKLEGFNIYAGGGLGRTHNKEETFARIADEIGFVAAADVYAAVKAIVAVQRDYGDRFDRRHSRMKYLINDWGVAKFRTHVEDYLGKKLEPAKPLPPWKYEDFLGWHEQGDGHLFLGLSIQNGRVHDQGDFKLRSALRQIVERFELPMLLTPHQNVLFYDIKPADRAAIETILKDCGVWAIEQIDPLERLSMACPAMPTCGLAITESERALPGFVERIRSLMERLGLGDESFVIRMTGCPNGCARPYMAELGFVGSAPSSYQVWLGGSPNQTRLAQSFVERMKDSDLESFLEPILVYFKRSRDAGESFGDFCNRVGFDTLRHFMQAYRPVDGKPEKAGSKRSGGGNAGPRHRIGIRDELYQQVQTLAADRGQSATALINEAIAAYLSQKP